MQNQVLLFQALATEIRLAIVLTLQEKDLSVGEILEGLGKTWTGRDYERTNISKHLTILKSVGILSCRGAGQKRIYHLNTPCLIEAVRCAERAIQIIGGGTGSGTVAPNLRPEKEVHP